MRRPHVRLAAACAFAAAVAISTAGAAFAGGGHGNSGNAPGQQKQEQQAQQAQQPQQQPSSQPQSSGAQAGVKPSNSTTHWTHCQTGASSSGATCTSSDNGHTPQTGADVSKRYGNGKTAAQIAVSRGGVGVQLTGPGNSQPHKVSDCMHKSNKSGGVDVHAIKSYSATGCESVAVPEQPSVKHEEHQKTEVHVKVEEHQKSTVAESAQLHVTICHATGTPDDAGNGYVTISPSASGVYHGHYRQHGADIIPPFTYNGQTYSANWTTNGQAIFNNGCHPVATSVAPVTQPAPTVPAAPVAPTVPTVTTTVPSTTVATTTATVTVTTTTGATTTVAGGVAGTTTTVQQAAPAATTTSSAGAVLGAQTSLRSKPASHGGVLGTVTHVAGGTLPFTGFPVWLAVLIALALILAGFTLRRRTLGTRP